jgi:hypothetical protein
LAREFFQQFAITSVKNPVTEPLEGFKPVQPRVFAGLFPISGEDYEKFRDALAKLRLNDAALQYEPENSDTKCSWPLEKILILSFGLISPSITRTRETTPK